MAVANTTYTYTFDSDATFSKGDVLAVKIAPENPNPSTGSTSLGNKAWNGTFVIEYDLTT